MGCPIGAHCPVKLIQRDGRVSQALNSQNSQFSLPMTERMNVPISGASIKERSANKILFSIFARICIYYKSLKRDNRVESARMRHHYLRGDRLLDGEGEGERRARG